MIQAARSEWERSEWEEGEKQEEQKGRWQGVCPNWEAIGTWQESYAWETLHVAPNLLCDFE